MIIEIIGGVLVLVSVAAILYNVIKELKESNKALQERRYELQEEMSTLLSQKKSSEVRLGFLVEHLAPLLDEFPYDIEDRNVTLVPLGSPIDFFVVTDDEIGFVEIKTGVSRLNASQQRVKRLVEEKKIVWHLIRIKPEEGGSGD